MGGGGFLLTDVVAWIPGRHEVDSRLALLAGLGAFADGPARVVVHVSDDDRVEVARQLAEAWPNALALAPRTGQSLRRRVDVQHRVPVRTLASHDSAQRWVEPESPSAGLFGNSEPLLAVHLGAGTAAKRWPVAHWKALLGRFLEKGWRVAVVGGPEDEDASAALAPHAGLRDWTGRLSVTQTTALLERADLFIGADSGPHQHPGGVRGDSVGRSLQRHEPVAAMAAVVAAGARVEAARFLSPVSSKDMSAR